MDIRNTFGTYAWPGFLLAAFLLQLPLVLNHGYFSHDELQWLALGDARWSEFAWPSWSDIHVFQYRPLTFSLWLLLSHVFGHVPMLMHLLHVSLGIANAALLRLCMLRLRATPPHAFIAALVFLLLPYPAYIEGWIGTYADMLCLAWLLLSILWLCREPSAVAIQLRSFTGVTPIIVFTLLALLSKESAVIFPCLLLCAAYRLKLRDLAPALIASGLVVGLYLALRLDTILFAPRAAGAYAWNIANIPDRIYEYSIFPFMPTKFEVLETRTVLDTRLTWAALALFTVLLAAANAGWRWLLVLVAGWCAALGPVSILSYSSSVYAYLATAFACVLFAVAYPKIDILHRGLFLVAVAMAIAHGVNIGTEIRRVGYIQHHLYRDLARLLPTASVEHPLRLKAADLGDESALLQLTFSIPSYHGQPLADRVVALSYADTNSRPTHMMQHNGSLVEVAP